MTDRASSHRVQLPSKEVTAKGGGRGELSALAVGACCCLTLLLYCTYYKTVDVMGRVETNAPNVAFQGPRVVEVAGESEVRPCVLERPHALTRERERDAEGGPGPFEWAVGWGLDFILSSSLSLRLSPSPAPALRKPKTLSLSPLNSPPRGGGGRGRKSTFLSPPFFFSPPLSLRRLYTIQ